MKYRKKLKAVFILLLIIFISGLLVPQTFITPVAGAGNKDWNPHSFWFYPWGKSGTHKGVDIFAAEGTPVLAATKGLVIYKGSYGIGGNVIMILGPEWRIHYYAHLKEIHTGFLHMVATGTSIASVGTTGNAAGKPPHLHYSICTVIPYFWQIDSDPHGWKKMFYINPNGYLAQNDTRK